MAAGAGGLMPSAASVRQQIRAPRACLRHGVWDWCFRRSREARPRPPGGRWCPVRSWSVEHRLIGAKYGLPYAEPLTFLLWPSCWRHSSLAVALLTRAPGPTSAPRPGHLRSPGLLAARRLSGRGVRCHSPGCSAGVMAVISGFSRMLTALAAGPLLGERVHAASGPGSRSVSPVSCWCRSSAGRFGTAGTAVTRLAFMRSPVSLAGTLLPEALPCSHMDLRTGGVIPVCCGSAGPWRCAHPVRDHDGALDAVVFCSRSGCWSGVVSRCDHGLLYILIRRGEAATRVEPVLTWCRRPPCSWPMRCSANG